MKKTIIFVTVSFLVGASHIVHTCTTAIVSGKGTRDGRPLLFKNRDTGSRQNRLVYDDSGTYSYTGVVDASDTLGTRVWSGVNNAGFAIMNSLSYNMNYKDTTTVRDKDNGTFMKLALETCGSLADFERLLDEQPKPLGVQANFGVIDAQGGAAYYESGNYGYTKIDANDPTVAPFGYIIRTNYSYTGPIDEGHGYIRYATADDLFYEAAAANNITARFIIRDVVRCLKHSLTETDLTESLPESLDDHRFAAFEDFIPRYSTASATIVQGVRPGENPDLTTMWTILGFPLCSVAFPSWVATESDLPKIAVAEKNGGTAPLGLLSFELKKRCFPIERGSGNKYIDRAVILNNDGTGTLQILKPLEDEIIVKTDEYLTKWREKEFSKNDAKRLYKWIDKHVAGTYEKMFGLDSDQLKQRRADAKDTGN